MSIEYIDIVHHYHADVGYTDHPLRARQLHAQFVGQAVDRVLETAQKEHPFAWTCETLLGVSDWLEQADEAQRDRFYQAVDTGNLDITAIPINVTPFLSGAQWDHLLNWMPERFWSRVPIRSAMQNDINGLPSAAVRKLLDRGVQYLWMGPNIHLAAPPFPTPHAFRWRIPDGRSMFVWLNGHYNNGFYLFNEFWREGPIPNSNDTHYRWPEADDIFLSDDASLEKAHRQCAKCVAAFEGREPNAGQFERDGFIFNKIQGGYPYRTLCVSITNHWRMDNDPPIAHLQAFVEAWNRKGYRPALRLVTATQAMRHIEEEAGGSLETVEGEWPDWWANGTMSCPRELSYSRQAKRLWSAAVSPVFGVPTPEESAQAAALQKQLCLFDEHTYGSWQSVSDPYGFDAVAAEAEVAILSYRALDGVKNLLADRFRKAPDSPGVWIANTGDLPYRGWVELPGNCLRGRYTHLQCAETGRLYALEAVDGKGSYARPLSRRDMSDEYETTDFADRTPGATLRFWLPELEPHALVKLLPSTAAHRPEAAAPCEIAFRFDDSGWPSCIRYPGRENPLYQPGFADFLSVDAGGLAPRWIMLDLFNTEDREQREALRAKLLKTTCAVYGETVRTETPHDVTFTQSFRHKSLKWAKRILTVSKQEPRARLTVRMRRKDQAGPEIYYLRMKLADGASVPVTSCASGTFRPGVDQIPNTCMDYYAIDGWVRYDGAGDSWFVSSLDAPMLTFARPNCFARLPAPPDDLQTMLFMLFDNTWDTNFVANSHGRFEYRFDLMQSDCAAGGQALADALAYEPPVLVNLRNQGEGPVPDASEP